MTALFADTFYWIALADRNDTAHERALQLASEHAEREIVTTDEVLTEFLTFFRDTPGRMRRQAAEAVAEILEGSAVRVMPQSHSSFLAGLDLYRARPDKAYSLTDCVSMQAMREEGLTEVLTNDRHFEQEGFQPLFRS